MHDFVSAAGGPEFYCSFVRAGARARNARLTLLPADSGPSEAREAGQRVDGTETGGSLASVMRSRAVAWALRMTVFVTVAAAGTSHYLARPGRFDETPAGAQAVRQAALRPGIPAEPETTGSLAGARQVRLDPCALPRP